MNRRLLLKFFSTLPFISWMFPEEDEAIKAFTALGNTSKSKPPAKYRPSYIASQGFYRPCMYYDVKSETIFYKDEDGMTTEIEITRLSGRGACLA
jgi:hypothetical protein